MKTMITTKILKLADNEIKNCKKLRMNNLISVTKGNLLLQKMKPVALYTKEQPDGFIYGSEENCSVVLRWIDGHLFNSKGQVDTYSWKQEKTEKFLKKGVKIGFETYNETLSLMKVLSEVKSEEEQELLFDFIKNDTLHDHFMVETPEENRKCIEITPELYTAGLTTCIDEWVEPAEDGSYAITELNVGDFLIVTENGVYCIREDEFKQTHTII